MRHIETKAEELLKEFGMDKAPIKPERIAKKLNINYSYTDLGDNVSGVLVVQNSKAKIGISNSDSEVRQNFSFAHEIAHYMLHTDLKNEKEQKLFVDDLQVMFRKNNSSRKEMMQEREANAYAAALLMPSDLIEVEFKRFLNRNKRASEDELIFKLSKKFKVSEIAMTYRLINLGYFNHRRIY